MNIVQFSAKWMRFQGELKQEWCKFTDEDLRQIEGSYDRFVGKVLERYGEERTEVLKWAKAWQLKTPPTSEKDITRL
jgi:uncharacterized protein YjbJ (UPF0337 family)